MTDQPGAISMLVPDAYTFDSVSPRWLVIHKTAGFSSAQQCAAYFQSGSDGLHVSAHYIIGLDGTIVQCVSESRGAGANCCVETGHAAYLPSDTNLNLLSISIEHIDPSTDNSNPVPQAQALASFKLIKDICARHGIPARPGDAAGGIIGHSDIAPQSRARCPGNYPWDALWTFLKEGDSMIPTGWKDDGSTLTAPNGITVVHGFRDWILSHAWDGANWPLEKEHGQNPLEDSNTAIGGGTEQTFRTTRLEWTPANGVFIGWLGQEYLKLRQELASARTTPAPAPAPDYKPIVSEAITTLQKLL